MEKFKTVRTLVKSKDPFLSLTVLEMDEYRITIKNIQGRSKLIKFTLKEWDRLTEKEIANRILNLKI